MPNDIAFLLLALTVSLVTMAAALPAVMGNVNAAARRAQAGVGLQALGWVLLLLSGWVESGAWQDRLFSSLSMACLAGGLALLAGAFDLWCGRPALDRIPTLIAVVLPVGYALGFSNYPFRVGWANGLLALQMAMVAASLARTPAVPVGRWRWLLVVSLLAQMVVTAWRGLLGAFFTESYPSFLSPHPVNYAFAVVANATSVLSLVGILLAHRDEAALALERLASLDGLTGVFNRRAWLAKANVELAVSVRYDHPLAVVMIDLDHFKQINDKLGHEAGDRALRLVASLLLATARTGDVVGRYGGEEFCVLMNHADSAAANAFDRRLRERLTDAASRELGFALSYSAGIAMRTAFDDSVQAMLARADATLYRAKAQGRARTFTLDETGLRLHAMETPSAC
ncbi:GGDEF domain-containing protein [Methylibium sp.]|uniref:GGDEF domain-containing protein n=1 Tax=Methylibium sp. TaxID=2067992 RepID=UPI0017990E51|nr:GGDEF domain-containing protein [Methylibium sp.]MBA3591612.1 GGDEF domain-containing protein [Methylibium sp.]